MKSLNSIEFEEWFFCCKALDSIKFLQCQTVSQPLPNPCQPHDVARRVHSIKLVPDLRQPHAVAHRVHSAKSVPDSRHLCGCTKSVSCQYENEGENESGNDERGNEGGNEGGSQIKTKSLI